VYKNIILDKLKKQKQALMIPYESIALRSGVGIATVKRAFAGNDVSFTTLEKVAVALNCEITIKSKKSPKALYRSQIEKKAQEVMERIIQSSALEGQAIRDEAKRKMLTKAKAMISKMPKSQIWG
jgi:acetolactate synthase regulatory subunit